MKKLLLLVALFALVIGLLTSCLDPGSSGGSGDNEGGGNEGGENGGESGGEGSGEGGSEEAEPEIGEGETLYYSKSEILMIASDYNSSRLAVGNIKEALEKNILNGGRAIIGNIYIAAEFRNEVVVGYVPEKPVSVEAYRLLGEIEKNPDKNESAYVVYADGGKIGVAYEVNNRSSYQPIDRLIEIFLEQYVLGKDQLFLEKGVVMSGVFDVDVLQAEADENYTNEKWAQIRQMVGDEDVTASVRNFFESMFDDKIISLIGTWYDPATGLFYASSSGKRAEGIYPIPEATNQVLGYISSVVEIPGTLVENLPPIVGYKIIYYVKSIQGEDGEFYVSQMKKKSIDSNRLGRDRTACLGLLSKFGGSPVYSVGSTRGDGITADEYWANLVAEGKVTEEEKPIIYWGDYKPEYVYPSVTQSVAMAVSHAVAASDVVAVASTTQFQSHEAFVKWLLAKDCYNNPYSAISNTSSAAAIISSWSSKLGGYNGEDKTVTQSGRSFLLKKGDTLNRILIKWMNSYINEVGLFGKATYSFVKDSNGEYIYKDGEYVLAEDGNGDYSPKYDGFFGGWGYQNSNGFFKGIGRYSGMRIAYPKPREAAESLLKGIATDESIGGNILVVYNVWSSLSSLRSNIKSYYEGEDKQEILDMIENTLWGKVVDKTTGETRTYSALALDKCLAKLLEYKKVDGGFGHSPNAGTGSWQGGLPVAIPSDNLSDMDAITCTTNGLGSAICSVLGFSMRNVPLHTEADFNNFLDNLLAQPYVVKTPPAVELPKSPAPESESFDKMPEWIKFGMGSGSTYEIVEKSGNNVLHISKQIGFTQFIYNGIGKAEDKANVTVIGMDILAENMTAISGIEIYPTRDDSKVFLPYLAFTSTDNGSDLMVYDHKTGMTPVSSGIVVGKWARLEIRYYANKKKYDLYVDGNYIMTGSYLRDGGDYPTASELNGVCVAMNSGNAGDFYYDNLYIHHLRIDE